MAREDFRRMIESEDFHPYVIKTKGGRSYLITHRTNAHISDAYPETVIVLVPGRGITLLGINSIEAIKFEHEVVVAG